MMQTPTWRPPKATSVRCATPLRPARCLAGPRTIRHSRTSRNAARSCASNCTSSSFVSRRSIWTWIRRPRRCAGASLVLGIFAVRFIEFFARRDPAPEPPFFHPFWPQPLTRDALTAQRPLLAAESPRLPAPDAPLRQLTDVEIAALLQAANDEG